jgi:signal transduction histidine kinase
MNVLRSVGARLSLALALVVLLALGIAYAIVVPSLERNLVDSRLEQLTQLAAVLAREFPTRELEAGDRLYVDDWVDKASVATSARVTLLRPLSERLAQQLEDSGGGVQQPRKDPVALDATLLGFGQFSSGLVNWAGTEHAEVAFSVEGPFGQPSVLLFSASLEPTLANVDLVKNRVLVAGAVALLVALLVGYGAAHLFARRIRRLERAADRIAGGDLDEPVEDRGSDELGQLARAFERMRGRLAQLEHARREFVANASHELRTPIFSLGGFLELLRDEDVDEATRREFLAAMGEQVDRLTRLAGDLLDLSRLDAGRLHVEAEPVDLGAIAEALREEFAPLARSEGHGITLRVDLGAPPALADELKVLQIGRVLVENALRHTAPGTPVQVHVGERDGVAVLTVQDLGAGIAAEHLPHVFERFYRADGGIATGSGLGLAIARELATLMGGTLEVDSRPGRTAFALTLPAATAAERAREPLAGAR